MNAAESYGQRLPFDGVNNCVIPQKSMLKMVEIAQFGGGSNKEIFVIASDIDAGNRNLGGTRGNWEDAVVKMCIGMVIICYSKWSASTFSCAHRSRSA